MSHDNGMSFERADDSARMTRCWADDAVLDGAGSDGAGLDGAGCDHVALIDEFAHAVRSALAVSSASLELVCTAPQPILDRDNLLAASRRNVAAARRALERLVDVARRPTNVQPAEFPIGAVVQSIVSSAHADASARQVAIDATIADDATVVADQHLLLLALECVIDGAIAAAVSPGLVAIDLTTGPGRVTMSIAPCPEASVSPTSRVALQLLAGLGARVSCPAVGPMIEHAMRIELPDGRGGRIESEIGETIDGWNRSSPPAAEGLVDGDECLADERPLVLLVEDDAEMRGLLEQTLSTEYCVVTAASAEDAYRVAAQVHPDVILCDIVLPGANGEQLVHRLREDAQFVGTPIIVVTGRTDDDLRIRLLHEGANDYVTKPFIIAELRARIANQIANRLGIAELKGKVDEAQKMTGQLQRALDSRVVIEQAKAFLAAERKSDLDVAFESLRSYARSNQLKIHDVAASVVRDGLRW